MRPCNCPTRGVEAKLPTSRAPEGAIVAATAQRCGPVLIADGDPETRTLIRRLLATIGIETREAANRDDALATARHENPPLVILDVALPPLSGYEVCRELRSVFGGRIAIIFVSDDRTEPRDRAAGLYLGADDYVVKPFDTGEFLARISRFLLPFHRGADAGVTVADLTGREREVLDLLARGLSQSAIARELVISPKTVANHIQNVLQKLGAHSRAEAVALAYQLGLTPHA